MRVSIRRVLTVLSALGVLLSLTLGASSAVAGAPGPGFKIVAVAGPTLFSPEHDGQGLTDTYSVYVTNSGSAPTAGPITIRDELPRGLTSIGAEGRLENEIAEGQKIVLPGGAPSCESVTATCTYGVPLLPGERLMLAFHVTVAPGTVGAVTDSVLVSGGGAPNASASVTTGIGTAAESTAEPFGIAAFSAETTGAGGLTDAQAGDHPYETTVTFTMNTIDYEKRGNSPLGAFGFFTAGRADGGAHVKDTVVDVPPGVTGDPTVVERCPQYKVQIFLCPPSSQIGIAKLEIGTRSLTAADSVGDPVYNVVPEKGYPAEFAILIPGLGVAVPLYVSVLPENGYEVRVTTPGIPEAGTPVDVSVTFFGTPEADPNVYNEYRTAVTGAPPTAFLDNPVDCAAGPQTASVYADSWENPGSYLANGQPNLADPRWASRSTTMFSSLVGCELLQFNPSLTVTPETTRADEPAGTSVEERFPQGPQQFPDLISPELKETTVTLPSGLSLDPSAGDGLAGCTDVQIGLGSGSVGSCPNGSQIGTIEVETPLLTEPLKGQVYLGTPHCDPCTTADASDGNMFRLFLQIEGSGVVIKQEGRIFTNASTGQLTTTFKDIPQLPSSNIKLHFNSGLRAGLATPQSCGTFTSTSTLIPWSSPITSNATPESQFNVDWNGNGEACPAVWPFHPGFEAGTSNPNAGQFSPLTVTFNREDREQDFWQIKVTTPPGLVGSLSGIPLCGEPQADLGTCSSASQIGEMTVAAGPGSHPFYQKGMVYLTGPYKGAPYGLSIVVPTRAGPFNLGNVVVRARINVDSYTTALTVTTDPLPQILDGIPLRLRKTNVTINRPRFIFNPTDCAQQHITATISGSQGTQAEVSTPFAVAGCAGLSFGPKFSVQTSGKTSKAGGASLDAKLVFPSGPQSNIAHVKVELPKQLPSRLTTLQKACPDSTFEVNPARCPAASVIGAVQAVTPILPVTLRGPVYFVSHGGAAFPNLVGVLQGYGVRVNLVGETFISKTGITSSTFTNVPDVTVFELRAVPPRGPLLRARREREPLQGPSRDADAVHRAGRRAAQTEHPDRRDRVPEGEEGQAQSEEGPQCQSCSRRQEEVMIRARTLTSVGLATLTLGALAAGPAEAHLVRPVSSFTPTGMEAPYGVAVDQATGDVYVTGFLPGNVEKFSATGARATSFVSPAFLNPEGVAVDNSGGTSKGDVYVTEDVTGARRVAKLDSSGKEVAGFTPITASSIPPGDPGSEELKPSSVAVDPTNGDVIVADQQREVDIFSSSGAFVSQFAVPGLEGVAVGSGSEIFTAGFKGAQEWSPADKYSTPTPIGPETSSPGIAVDLLTGDVLVDGPVEPRYITEYKEAPGAPPTWTALLQFGSGLLEFSGGVAVDEVTDTVYASSPERNSVDVFGATELLAEAVTGAPARVTSTTASVAGTVNPEGAKVAGCRFEYGLSASYGYTSACSPEPPLTGGAAIPVEGGLSGLQPGKLYHYRLVATTAGGGGYAGGVSYGEDETFTTQPAAPSIDSESVSALTQTSATLNASINPNNQETTYHFEYGATTAYGTVLPVPDASVGSGYGDVVVGAELTGLRPGTTYHFRVLATNASFCGGGDRGAGSDVHDATAAAAGREHRAGDRCGAEHCDADGHCRYAGVSDRIRARYRDRHELRDQDFR